MRGKLKVQRTALIVIGALALAGLVVSPAIGLRGALSPLQAKKFFLKKKAASRVYLSKADADRRFLSKAEGDARFAPKGEAYSKAESDSLYLRPEGTIEVTVGPSSWVLAPGNEFLADPQAELSHLLDASRVEAAGEGIAVAHVAPSIPTALYGRGTRIVAAELCYDAASNAQLQSVTMSAFEQSAGIEVVLPSEEIASDNTARTDNACRTYRPPEPVPLSPDRMLSLAVVLNFNTKADASFLIGRTTFTLLP